MAEILSLSLMQGCAPLVVVSQLLCPTGGDKAPDGPQNARAFGAPHAGVHQRHLRLGG